MDNVKMPTREEVTKLLTLMINSPVVHEKTIGELLGLKLVDSLLPPMKGEPEWGYEGLKEFFLMHNIVSNDTLGEALEKLQ